MITSDLECHNVFYSTKVENPGGGSSCLDCISGSRNQNAVILKGVNMNVMNGEVVAVLGSKGSGKKALLDVISQQAYGDVRGQVFLNGSIMTKKLFQQRCAYVKNTSAFIPGLTLAQMLQYTPTILSGNLKRSKIRQILADLALSQVSKKRVEHLNISERRRLSIGMQILRDPVIMLLDEPTYGLNPLNAYLVISILSNYAKKSGCGIVLSLEKPRSDVFPFLDKAVFLCLGGVVYSGGTRNMLEYFHNIGFPCPQQENPLMYYLCLATVDRRSRDRFIESSQQIEALIDRFALENPQSHEGNSSTHAIDLHPQKIPLGYGKPSSFTTWRMICLQLLASTFSCSSTGFKFLFLRLLFLPVVLSLNWIWWYGSLPDNATGFHSRLGLFLQLFGLISGCVQIITIQLFPPWRRFILHEYSHGLYSGIKLIIGYNLISFIFSLLTSAIAACAIYPLLLDMKDLQPNEYAFLYLIISIWTTFIVVEQLFLLLMLFITNPWDCAIVVTTLTISLLSAFTGAVRSYKGLPDILKDISKYTQTYHSSILFYSVGFLSRKMNCVSTTMSTCPRVDEYLNDRIGEPNPNELLSIVWCFSIAFGLAILNIICFSISRRDFRRKIILKQRSL